MNSKLLECKDFHDSCTSLVSSKKIKIKFHKKKINNFFNKIKLAKFLIHLKYSLKVYPLIHLIPIILNLRKLKTE